MRNYISQGLGRKQTLTQMVFLKMFLMKGRWWPHRGGQDSEGPQGVWRHPGTSNDRNCDIPSPRPEGQVGKVTLRVCLRAGACKRGHQHPLPKPQGSRECNALRPQPPPLPASGFPAGYTQPGVQGQEPCRYPLEEQAPRPQSRVGQG